MPRCGFWSLIGSGSGGYSKDELLWSVRYVLDTIARRRPLVVIFDDIHWAEPIFLDLIEHVADTSDGVPLLIVCAARHELLDEYPGFLAGRRGAHRIELHELSRPDTARVLGNLIGDVQLPLGLEDRILSVADGNPLFAEQMTSMLIDSGVVGGQDGRWAFDGRLRDVTVPPNISSLLASRLDRLPPLERGLVERAAVIGLEFPSPAIAALAADGDSESDLGPPLSALCGKRLVRPVDARPDGTDYQFSHILVRDAAYDRLLKRTRARLHERYADWLLKVSGTRAAEFEEIIGYHLEQSFRYRAELGPLDAHARSLGERAARAPGRRRLEGDRPR